MGSRIISVKRPEGGEEHGVVWYRHHGCQNAKVFRSAMENPDIDILQFPVGLVGYEMPLATPFAVVSSNACGVCGVQVGAWFEWTGSRLVDVSAGSALWTP